MKKLESEQIVQYQLFIEPKGPHLVKTDQWKEDFFIGIEYNYEVVILTQDKKYKLLGLPFYTETNKSSFIDYFNEKIEIK